MSVYENNELSPREYVLLEHDKEEARLGRQHAIEMKKLDLELAREKNASEVALRTLEAKWSSWLRLPKLLLMLPVYFLLGIASIVSSIRNQKIDTNFWRLIK